MARSFALLAVLGVAHGLVTPRIASTAFGTQHVAKRFNPRRAATLEPPKQELPTLPLLRFASPGLADWTSAHLLAAPSQRLLAGVSADRAAADRITVVGGLVNVGLTVAKLAAGVVGHSAALISDAAHSASDLASDVVTFVAMRAARLPADDDHPYGHARFETIGALVVGAMLVAAGAGAAGHALHVGGHAHHHLAPGKIALAAALLSVVAKELLFRATARVGRRLKSPVLEANAWHHRSDALSSVVALLGVAAARLPGGAFASADALAGLAVAFMLGWTGARIALGALKELSDAVDHGDLDGLRFRALNVPGVASVASMRGVAVAGALRVDVDVVSDAEELSSSAANQLAEQTRVALLATDDGDDDDGRAHAHGHSHGHSHAHDREGPPRVAEATVRVVPAEKTCPVVASLPTQATLDGAVAAALERRGDVKLKKTQVHYVDGLKTELDVFLAATTASGDRVADLRAAARAVAVDLDAALEPRATVQNVYWTLDE